MIGQPVEPDADAGTAPELTLLAVRGEKAARLLDISGQSFRRLDLAGQLPKPVHLGKCRRWVVADLKAWLDAGSPPRHQWELRKESQCGTS